jgi:hypothetical protein
MDAGRRKRCAVCIAVESNSLSLRLWVDIIAAFLPFLFLGVWLCSLLRYFILFMQGDLRFLGLSLRDACCEIAEGVDPSQVVTIDKFVR